MNRSMIRRRRASRIRALVEVVEQRRVVNSPMSVAEDIFGAGGRIDPLGGALLYSLRGSSSPSLSLMSGPGTWSTAAAAQGQSFPHDSDSSSTGAPVSAGSGSFYADAQEGSVHAGSVGAGFGAANAQAVQEPDANGHNYLVLQAQGGAGQGTQAGTFNASSSTAHDNQYGSGESIFSVYNAGGGTTDATFYGDSGGNYGQSTASGAPERSDGSSNGFSQFLRQQTEVWTGSVMTASAANGSASGRAKVDALGNLFDAQQLVSVWSGTAALEAEASAGGTGALRPAGARVSSTFDGSAPLSTSAAGFSPKIFLVGNTSWNNHSASVSADTTGGADSPATAFEGTVNAASNGDGSLENEVDYNGADWGVFGVTEAKRGANEYIKTNFGHGRAGYSVMDRSSLTFDVDSTATLDASDVFAYDAAVTAKGGVHVGRSTDFRNGDEKVYSETNAHSPDNSTANTWSNASADLAGGLFSGSASHGTDSTGVLSPGGGSGSSLVRYTPTGKLGRSTGSASTHGAAPAGASSTGSGTVLLGEAAIPTKVASSATGAAADGGVSYFSSEISNELTGQKAYSFINVGADPYATDSAAEASLETSSRPNHSVNLEGTAEASGSGPAGETYAEFNSDASGYPAYTAIQEQIGETSAVANTFTIDALSMHALGTGTTYSAINVSFWVDTNADFQPDEHIGNFEASVTSYEDWDYSRTVYGGGYTSLPHTGNAAGTLNATTGDLDFGSLTFTLDAPTGTPLGSKVFVVVSASSRAVTTSEPGFTGVNASNAGIMFAGVV